MTGGSVTITGDIAADANLTNITSTVDLDEADVAISASKTLTLTAAQADVSLQRCWDTFCFGEF